MFLASGEIGDTGKPEQGLLFQRFALYFLYPGLWDLGFGTWGLRSGNWDLGSGIRGLGSGT